MILELDIGKTKDNLNTNVELCVVVVKKRDIISRSDIEKVIIGFYDKVHQDSEMAPIFIMPKEQMDIHLERTGNFWENWLFQTGNYGGGLMWKHIEKHREHPLSTHLFEKWLSYWILTIDELYIGAKADFMKSKAIEIAQIMNQRLNA